MSILHVISSLGPGGAERTLSNICLNSKKHIHYIVCLTKKSFYSNELEENNIKIYELKMNKFPNILIAPIRLYIILRKIRPAIVHTWMYHSDFFGGILAKLAGTKIVLWNIRNSTLKKPLISNSGLLISWINSLLSYFIPNQIICCGNYVAQSHIKYGYDSSKIRIIYNGVDTKLFSPNSQNRSLVRIKYKIETDTILLGMMARYTPAKDHRSLLKSLSLCKNSKQKWICILSGQGMDSTNSELVEMIKSLKLSDKVKLIGNQRNVNKIYNALDLHLCSSTSEGFPNCLLEALSSGVPCIATNVGDAQFILKDNGWIINPSDHYQLAQAVKNFFRLTEAEKIKISKSSRNKILSDFSLLKMVVNYDNLYSEFI